MCLVSVPEHRPAPATARLCFYGVAFSAWRIFDRESAGLNPRVWGSATAIRETLPAVPVSAPVESGPTPPIMFDTHLHRRYTINHEDRLCRPPVHRLRPSLQRP